MKSGLFDVCSAVFLVVCLQFILWYEYGEPMYKVFFETQYSVEIHQTINLQFRFERERAQFTGNDVCSNRMIIYRFSLMK